ncbi:MAG: ornithine carbamoyltransferase [Gammaproteobacteria bacterium HGW-Gammaproteobacteria-7]|nr:MAG: ornithine carbamoyltransferase [Gammaproteobacteria bacterium HGW-Gammaproteobacteria-7]
MAKRDFLSLLDLSRTEILELLALAARIKAGEHQERPLEGKSLALIFAKSSTRTRVSFEVGIRELGGHPIFLSSRDIQLGRGEPIADTARVLSRMVDGIMIRTFAHSDVEELARAATVPVINGLTDLLHPCQLLADLLTMQEAFGSFDNRVVAWIGDGNNMANCWLEAAALLGFELRLACPEGYEPDHDIFAMAAERTRVIITEDPDEAAAGADVINTDVWASMGQEDQAEQRALAFAGYCVDAELMALANPAAILLHCLPAHRGEEISADVLDGPQSRIWDEAENRLHVQKALMTMLFR